LSTVVATRRIVLRVVVFGSSSAISFSALKIRVSDLGIRRAPEGRTRGWPVWSPFQAGPGGTFDNSPHSSGGMGPRRRCACHRHAWGKADAGQRGFSRLYGDVRSRDRYPAINRWATIKRPSGARESGVRSP